MSHEQAAELRGLWAQRDRSKSASDAVHRAIREAILSGVLPPGVRLHEEDLAGLLAVSRTPVREGILRLETEGLATRANRIGLVVASVSRDEILEQYVVRAALDGLAASLAARGARVVDIAALSWINRQIADAAQKQEWDLTAGLNLQFHETLARASHNSVLVDLILGVHDKVRRYPGTTLSVGERASEAVREHEAIIAAIADHDSDTAEALSRRHMELAMEIRMAMLFPE